MYELKDNYTTVPNEAFVIMTFINGSEVKVFFYIIRKTIGFHKKSDGISISQLVKGTGLGKAQVIRAKNSLQERKLIKVTNQTLKNGGQSYNRYEINFKTLNSMISKGIKGLSQNDTGGSLKMIQGVVSKRDRGSLKMIHTKETNTKYNNNNTIASHEGDTTVGINDIEFTRLLTELRFANKQYAGKREDIYKAYMSVRDFIDVATLVTAYRDYIYKQDKTVGFKKFIQDFYYLSYLPKEIEIFITGEWVKGSCNLEDEVFTTIEGDKAKFTHSRYAELLQNKHIRFNSL